MKPVYVIHIRENEATTCFPKGMDTKDFIETTPIGDTWASFIDPSGKRHSCYEYYQEYFSEYKETMKNLLKDM